MDLLTFVVSLTVLSLFCSPIDADFLNHGSVVDGEGADPLRSPVVRKSNKRREIIDYLNSSKPIFFGGNYNFVSQWTGEKDVLNDDDNSFVHQQIIENSHNNNKRTRNGKKLNGKKRHSLPNNNNDKNSTSVKNNNHYNEKKPKSQSKHHKKTTANLNRRTKSVAYKDEERPPWGFSTWNGGGIFRKAARCVDIPSNMTLCRGVGYDRMRVPNLLDHESENEAVVQSSDWVPLWTSKCHRDTRIFLCSLFAPVCLEQPIYPCKSLCKAVKDSCLTRMAIHGYPWPQILDCAQFPDDTGLCIGVREKQEKQKGNECPVCAQVDKIEDVIDSFCNAEFVVKIRLERVELVNNDVKLISSRSKKFYKKPDEIARKHISWGKEWLIRNGAKCDCPVTKELMNFQKNQSHSSRFATNKTRQNDKENNQSKESKADDPAKWEAGSYLIMGNRRKGKRMVLTFARPLKRGSSSLLNKALQMLTGDDRKICSTMSR